MNDSVVSIRFAPRYLLSWLLIIALFITALPVAAQGPDEEPAEPPDPTAKRAPRAQGEKQPVPDKERAIISEDFEVKAFIRKVARRSVTPYPAYIVGHIVLQFQLHPTVQSPRFDGIVGSNRVLASAPISSEPFRLDPALFHKIPQNLIGHQSGGFPVRPIPLFFGGPVVCMGDDLDRIAALVDKAGQFV